VVDRLWTLLFVSLNFWHLEVVIYYHQVGYL
jgi:hypothetical protein